MTRIGSVVMVLTLVVSAVPAFATVWSEWYVADFQTAVDSNWDVTQRTAAPIDANRLFLGRFGTGDSASLTLSDLPQHTGVRISFDFYAINTWEPTDHFYCADLTDGLLLVSENPAAIKGRNDLGTFPGDEPYNTSRADSYTATGLGADATTLVFKWVTDLDQAFTNESWGLDNVRVELGDVIQSDPPETTPELSSSALILLGALPVGFAWYRRRRS